MKKIFYLSRIAVFILVGTFSSCVSKYDAVLPDTPKTLVVNSFMTNVSIDSAEVQISQAVSSLSSNWLAPDATGAVVELFENGTKIQTLTNQNAQGGSYIRFTPNKFVPQAGKTYRLEAKFSGFEAVSAEQTMPSEMPAFSAKFRDTISLGNPNGGGFGGGGGSYPNSGVEIAFTDNGSTDDYYEVQVYMQDSIDTDNDGINDALSAMTKQRLEQLNAGL